MQYKCLSIAGFDGSGGAGIQADLKTFSAFGCYGMTVLTSLPIQNTYGVKECFDIPPHIILKQLETIFEDIIPDSIKIGMLYSKEIIEVVANFLKYNAKNIPIILDPVMVAKSGDSLLLAEAVLTLKDTLIPLATILTPNLPEGYALTHYTDNFEELGHNLLQLNCKAVLLKGGHSDGPNSNDLFLQDNHKIWLTGKRITSNNTHGTGCTLSAAICAAIANGLSLIESCRIAKNYLFHAINSTKDFSVGKGYGPVNHFYHLWPCIDKIKP